MINYYVITTTAAVINTENKQPIWLDNPINCKKKKIESDATRPIKHLKGSKK